ncbi:NAD(P)-dependent oxidoreductase [Sphingomonas turrisvirgatae]|uniref:NAD(P)-dependent oxidoreductase n=1 Tax=Sphingomonas turrisvirgatae TaxID=1888892 RepID=A0A1E3LQM0_9SPHN|nr:NAD(P)-dependent oxidoreductase [Sphingomonas turrisvirgatae]ODP36056.1 NAD(P)-dependent oxidoreductase [Sphingomonas turrisvirgatae]
MRLLIFGLGYTASHVAAALPNARIAATGSNGDLSFHDGERVRFEIANATHILSSVPPDDQTDPVLAAYGEALSESGAWLGYLSSTGVYGDSAGAWVDEQAPIGQGRRGARAAADRAWLGLGARVFRLPGIYGPGRSPLDRIRAGEARRIDVPGQVFSRIHVSDIARGVIAALDAPAGAYNLADDEPAPQSEVVAFGCRLLGLPVPPLVPLDQADLSPASLAFYSENRRVANGKAQRVMGWRPLYPDYRFGLRALNAMTRPIPASSAPAPASSDQR